MQAVISAYGQVIGYNRLCPFWCHVWCIVTACQAIWSFFLHSLLVLDLSPWYVLTIVPWPSNCWSEQKVEEIQLFFRFLSMPEGSLYQWRALKRAAELHMSLLNKGNNSITTFWGLTVLSFLETKCHSLKELEVVLRSCYPTLARLFFCFIKGTTFPRGLHLWKRNI